ncbi:S-adenosyl-L-methionine-dependent methyltransferase [Aspergillus californicus]
MPLRNLRSSSGDNPRWAEVDTYSIRHSHPASRPNTKALEETLAASDAGGLPRYALSASQAKFIALHCRAAAVTHVLEVGTLGGYSAIWMASENPGLHVTTIEYNTHHAEVARMNIARAGLDSRIEVYQGAALDVLPRLQQEVLSGDRSRFGFVFIDADKVNSWKYFQLARGMIRPGSVICVDNVVRGGQVLDGEDDDPSVKGSREVVEMAGKETGVDSVVLQTVGEKGYDGWLWAVAS